ncbi:MAG: hypothetical protein JWO57_2402 [Pseudonocardiales bacterium]|nr:hypothetical protein [Pseudonocardiales bacterium]
MFVRMVDESLERLLRDELPLPEDLGDVSFDAPSGNWSAQLSRITVNLFLYEVVRSSHPASTPTQRVNANGKAERRAPQPMVELNYLVSAWAGSPRDEHQLLGDVISRLAARTSVPTEHLPAGMEYPIGLSFDGDQHNRIRDVWNAAGAHLKASFSLQVTVAADTFDWEDQAPPVTRIEALTAPRPAPR